MSTPVFTAPPILPLGPRFKDVIGLQDAKRALRDALLLPTLFSPKDLCGIRSVSSCVLLFGPPGTGKTVLAEAAANESNRPLFRVSPSSVLSRFVGESEKNLLQVFLDASLSTPHQGFVFFDEIDAIAPRRDGGAGGGDVDIAARRLLNELLLLLSALPLRFPGVFVCAATNSCENIDAALLRRFSTCIFCAPPSFRERKLMIKSLLRDITSDLPSDELDKISALTDGWTGSDLKGLAVEAAMAPLRDALSGGKKTRKRVYSILPKDDTGGDGDNGDDQVDERTGRKRVRDYDDNDDEANDDEDDDDDDDDNGEWLPQSWAQHSSQPLMTIRAVTAIDFENALTICFPSARHHQQQQPQQQQQQQHDQQQHFFFNPPHDDPDTSNSSSSSDLVWTTDDTSLSTSDPVFLEGQEGEGKEGEGEITTTPSYV